MSSYTDSQYRTREGYPNTEDFDVALQEGLLKRLPVASQEQYECQVCHCNMAGSVPARAHLKGTRHFKALRNHNTNVQFNEPMLSREATPPLGSNIPVRKTSSSSDLALVQTALNRNIVTEKSVSGVVVMTCNVCNIDATGEVPMGQHLEGESHRKRLRRAGIALEGTDIVVTDRSGSPPSLPTDPMKNLRLQDTFSTSSDPGMEVEDAVAKALKSGVIIRARGETGDGYTCTVCRKACTGVVPLKQHLQSSAHLKKMGMRRCVSTPNTTSTLDNSELNPRRSLDRYPTSSTACQIEEDLETSRVAPRPSLDRYPTRSTARQIEEDLETSRVAPRPSLDRSYPTRSTARQIEDLETCRVASQNDPLSAALATGIVIKDNNIWMCIICTCKCTGESNMTDHLTGDLHRRKLREQEDELSVFGSSSSSARMAAWQRGMSSRNYTPEETSQMSGKTLGGRSLATDARHQKNVQLPENLEDVEVYLSDMPIGKL